MALLGAKNISLQTEVDTSKIVKKIHNQMNDMIEYFEKMMECLIEAQNNTEEEKKKFYEDMLRELFPHTNPKKVVIPPCIEAVRNKIDVYKKILALLKLNTAVSRSTAMLILKNISDRISNSNMRKMRFIITDQNMEYNDIDFIDSLNKKLSKMAPDGYDLLNIMFSKNRHKNKTLTLNVLLGCVFNKKLIRQAFIDYTIDAKNSEYRKIPLTWDVDDRTAQLTKLNTLIEDFGILILNYYKKFKNDEDHNKHLYKIIAEFFKIFPELAAFRKNVENIKRISKAEIDQEFLNEKKNSELAYLNKKIGRIRKINFDHSKWDFSDIPESEKQTIIEDINEAKAFQERLIEQSIEFKDFFIENFDILYNQNCDEFSDLEIKRSKKANAIKSDFSQLIKREKEIKNNIEKIRQAALKREKVEKVEKIEREQTLTENRCERIKLREELSKQKRQEELMQWRAYCQAKKAKSRAESSKDAGASSSSAVPSSESSDVVQRTRAFDIFSSLSNKRKELVRQIVLCNKGVTFTNVKNLVENKLGGRIKEIGNGSSHKRIEIENFRTIITSTTESDCSMPEPKKPLKKQRKGKGKRRSNQPAIEKGTLVKTHGKSHNSDEIMPFGLSQLSRLFIKIGFTKEMIGCIDEARPSSPSPRP